MKKLVLPIDDMEVSFDACTSSIIDKTERSRFNSILADLIVLSDEYFEAGRGGEIYTIVPNDCSILENPAIVGSITSDEFIMLYGYNMVKRPQGRAVYNRIMAAAKEECPFCGGIGHTKNLDHYLPKASFAQYSVFPANLIPSCRDCNMEGKGSGFAKAAKDQLIHPYLDKDLIFNEQWVFARVIDGSSQDVVIEYYVNPPEIWSDIDKSRVKNHFKKFDLAKRYSIEAGRELSGLLDQRNSSLEKLGANSFKEALITPISESDKLFANHWRKVMYNALETDFDFYQC